MELIENKAQILQVGCSLIRKQSDKLAGHFAEMGKTEDAEPLHQTRVACRRLRETLLFFADFFEIVYIEDWKKATKKLLRQLSEPRDLDVQIEFLSQFLSGLGPELQKVRPGIERLLLRLKQRRRKLQGSVMAAVKRFQKKHVLPNLRLQIDKVLYLAEINPAVDSLEKSLNRFLRQVLPRLEEVQKQVSCLSDPVDAEGHHKFRIAIKKLRYTVEIIDVFLSGKLAEYLDSLKEAQTVLGELHDCDVWFEMIDHFEGKEKQRMVDYIGHMRSFGRLRPGLKYLRDNRGQLRQIRYQEAVELIGRWNEHGFLEQLTKNIEQISQ